MPQKSTNITSDVTYEHERRFLPDPRDFPFIFRSFPFEDIQQTYLEHPERCRIRDSYKDYKHIYTKTIKTGSGISRKENEHEISIEEYHSLLNNNDNNCSLSKTRYFVGHKGVNFQFNVFHFKDNTIYVQIEIEFNSNEEALKFITPSYFGTEVTDDERHTSYSIAKYGPPK